MTFLLYLVPLAATWMDLEMVTLSEVSEAEKGKHRVTPPTRGFPGGQCRKHERCGFDPWVGKSPWRRERLSAPVFWPGEFHGLYSPWGRKESDMTERLN